ncbi:MAG: GWxTD domain-containing protein, partial [Vicinamibacteria bacterium]
MSFVFSSREGIDSGGSSGQHPSRRTRFVVGFMKLAAAIVLVLVGGGSAPADERLDRLPPEDRKWIEEEVVYIITDRERELFLSLGSSEERKRFIEAFWAKRDPNRTTPENEFRVEHYRRIEHANRVLGRDSFHPGRRTDRGRMYIKLGEPREIQRFEGHADLLPAELWFYQGDTRLGMPSFFYLLFYMPDDAGEFELYHPLLD